ncbi:MAG: hypothetical protein Q8M92_10665 [Candidatus Subteraquimicrobiales bacterium]|nr:hypothetical protein [Candidatus Subteraquimicrobiales bacterium]
MGRVDLNIGDQAIESDIRNIANRLPKALTNLLDDLSSEIEILMRDEAPVRMGDLQKSVTTDSISNLERLIWPTVEHAAYVILGTDPHTINSATQIEGNWVYIGEHPGTDPNDFPSRAIKRAGPSIESRMESFYKEMLR